MSLKTRLALLFALSVAAALLLQGLASYYRLSQLLAGDLDRSLLGYVEALAEGHPFRGRGEYAFRLWVPGRPQASPNFPDLPEPKAPGAFWRGEWRVLVLRVQGGFLEVARYSPDASLALAHQRRALALSTLLFSLLAFGLALGWAGLALRPLAHLTQGARRVAASLDLSHRVPEEGGGELGELAQAFNHMLDRLKGFLERERRFTQAAAHELRTPLAGARAQLEALERGFLPPEEALPALKAELARLERLVEGLLILARENRVDRVELDLALLAQEAARRYGVPYEGPERLPFQGDPILLGRALENLLENALRHGEGKGVKVRLEGRALCVEDQGPGLSEEERALAQTPFWRKGKAPGEGLGLAVAAQVAEAHGGRLLLLPNTPQGLRACLAFGEEKTA